MILKGISFPFRVGNKGGVVMSKADLQESTHIDESLQQIIGTCVNERIMENFGCKISTHIFDPSDSSTYTLIRYEIAQAIQQYDTRVKVGIDDINIEEGSSSNEIIVIVNYLVIANTSKNSLKLTLGGD